MAYGLKILGGNSILQLDSDRTNTYGLIVTASGAASSLTLPSGYNTLVFIQLPSSGAVRYPDWNATYTSVTFRNGSGTATSTNYILAKPGNQVASDVSGTYGLKVLASNGTTVIFDSRAFTNAGFAPTKVITAGTLSSTNKTITTDSSLYVCINWGWWVNSSVRGGIENSSGTIRSTVGSNASYDILVAEKLT